MTSKHCFFKMMREDFRHKIWMFALSVLGNMLAIPVVYLISMGYGYGAETAVNLTNQANDLEIFFGPVLLISGGIVAIIGALIVGLSEFRYLFHRNMVDTYHSIPVRRRTLFWANWLNGFLIWFVPFLVSLCATLLLALSKLGALRASLGDLVLNAKEKEMVSGWVTEGGLIANALLSLLALTTAFLLVYHLVLLAVMLCGNVLNTLVTASSLGVGAITVYFLIQAFCSMYFDTYLSNAADGYDKVVYASPLLSSVLLLYRRVVYFETGEGTVFWSACSLDLVIALALGALALWVYLKRPSELAEQGVRIKPVRFLIQIVVTLGAAMSGWLLFYIIGDSMGLFWAVFGTVLAGIVTFGVLDIIFHMDFKAFFAHKLQMVLTVAAGVLIGFMFYCDWLGYDRYLPDMEAIAEIAVYDSSCSNTFFYGYDKSDEEHPLNAVHIRDREAAYAFLETAVDAESNRACEDEDYGFTETIMARVTLNSGRTYYRFYSVSSNNSEPAFALLTTAEYLDANFRIRPEEEYEEILLERNQFSEGVQMSTKEGAKLFEALREAYNRDLEESPEVFIRGGGRRLCRIVLYGRDYNHRWFLDVYEDMKYTREALRQQGFGTMAEPVQPEAVEEIQLSLGYRRDGYEAEDLVEWARGIYGVLPKEDAGTEAAKIFDEPAGEAVETYDSREEQEILLHVTERAEIEELLELISYCDTRSTSVFRPREVGYVTIVPAEDGEDQYYNVTIPLGALPEKYIQRFGTLQTEE